MPQPIWPTCIAFRHKLQPITQAEINACHLGYARSMRTMHLCIRSTVFFATIAYPFLHLIHRTLIFFLSLFFNRSHTTILVLNHFYSPLSKTQFRRIPDFRGYIYNPPPSWEGVSLSSTQPEDELSSFRSIPSRIYIIHAA